MSQGGSAVWTGVAAEIETDFSRTLEIEKAQVGTSSKDYIGGTKTRGMTSAIVTLRVTRHEVAALFWKSVRIDV